MKDRSTRVIIITKSMSQNDINSIRDRVRTELNLDNVTVLNGSFDVVTFNSKY